MLVPKDLTPISYALSLRFARELQGRGNSIRQLLNFMIFASIFASISQISSPFGGDRGGLGWARVLLLNILQRSLQLHPGMMIIGFLGLIYPPFIYPYRFIVIANPFQ